jgi:thioredoxin
MRFLTIVLLVTVLLGFLFWATYALVVSGKTERAIDLSPARDEQTSSADRPATTAEIVTVDAAELEVFLQQDTPVLVGFWASWCAACKTFDPILESLADEFSGRATFLRVDVDASRDLAERFEISSVPVVIIFVDGGEVARFEGVTREHVLRKSLDQAGATQAVAGQAADKQVVATGGE